VLRTGAHFGAFARPGRVRDGHGRGDGFLLTFTEREKIYNLAEALSGARFTTSYTRIGGVMRDLPPGWVDQCRNFCDEFDWCARRGRKAADAQPHLGGPHCATWRDFEGDAIDYGLSGPNLRGSGVEWDLRKNSRICATQLEFDIPWARSAIATTVIWCAWRKCARACAFCASAWKKFPAARTTNQGAGQFRRRQNHLPPKEKVLTSMEELIHQFILVTEGVNARPGEVYFGHENPKGELGFYINSKGGGTPYRMKIRAQLCQPEHHPQNARPHDQRHGGHFRLARFRHGRVRPTRARRRGFFPAA
jgi:NADH-quinone oxidoreductase subunit D